MLFKRTIATVIAFSIVLPLFAQDGASTGTDQGEPSASIELDTIDVTAALPEPDAREAFPGYVAPESSGATKTGTPVSETPQAITVIGEDQIEDQNARSLGEVLRYVGGTVPELRSGAGARYDYLMQSLRGFAPDFYLDGLRLPIGFFATAQADPYLLQRVEIVKGPASVLYGQTPPGGLINLMSKRPVAEPFFGNMTLTSGTSQLLENTFDIGGQLGSDGRLRYRLVGAATSVDGMARTTEERRYSIAPSLTWAITDGTALTLLASYRADPEAGWYGSVPTVGSLQENPNGELPRDFYDGDIEFENFDRRQTLVGYEFEHQFNDIFTVRQNARYSRIFIDYKSVYANGLQVDNRTLSRSTAASEEDLWAVALDNQLIANFATGNWEHTVLAGIDYAVQNNDRATGFGAAPTIDIYNPDSSQTITPPTLTDFEDRAWQIGGYLQEQVRFGSWVFLAGGRFDAFSQERITAGTKTTDLDGTALTGRGGLLYELDFGLAPYASYTQSFQPQTNTDINDNFLDPTRGEQFEVGLKYEPAGQNALVTLSAFQLTQSNVATPDPNDPNSSVQTGEIRVRGLELESKASLRFGLDLSAVATLLDPEVTRDNTNQGKSPARTPEVTGAVWLDYTLPIVGNLVALSGLEIGAGVRYVGEQYSDPANTADLTIPDYTLFDAALRYRFEAVSPDLTGLQVSVNVTNLTDKKYVVSGYGDFGWFWWGEGREIVASLSYSW